MKSAPSVESGWSAARWVAIISLLFVLQGVVAWRLADRRPLVVRDEARVLAARLAPPTMAPELAALLKLGNPTLFVLPSRDGFSGTAWLETRPLQHRSPGWSNPPQWLALKPAELLADFGRFDATNQPERASVSDRLSRPQEARAVLTGDLLLPAKSRATLVGEITERDLVSPLELPAVDHGGLLTPSVVSFWVDKRGRVFQASLAPAGTSGSPAVDQLALAFVRQLKFTVDPRISPGKDNRDFDELRRGRITIYWWTRPPSPATNAPPAAPAAVPVQS